MLMSLSLFINKFMFSTFIAMTSSEEECDYMSEEFLLQCCPKDVKPGLTKTKSQQRELEVAKRQQELREEARQAKRFKKSTKELEVEAREEGLSTKLDSSNKGFALLEKMGYKPGTGLGKTGGGREEPVEVVVKEGRSGLGRDEAMRRIAMEKCRIIEQRTKQIVNEFDPAAFRAQMREKHLARRIESDLYKAQKSCRDLDSSKDFSEPAESWFWPAVEKTKTEEEEEESEEEAEEELFSVGEKLSLLLTYIRVEHFYCLYCGIKYESQQDMTETCPGPSREDHDDV